MTETREMSDRGHLLVVFDSGSLSPEALLTELSGRYRLAVAVPRQHPDRADLELLFEAADVFAFDGEAELSALAADLTLVGVLTFSEPWLRAANSIARRHGLPALLDGDGPWMTDKHAQRERLAAAGIPQPRTRAVDRTTPRPSDIVFPAVLKPRSGVGSRSTVRVDRWEQVESALEADPDVRFVLEELLEGVAMHPLGDYVSVESVVVDGRPRTLAVVGKLPLLPPFREQGHLLPATLDAELADEVSRMVDDALVALGACHVLTHTEVKLTPLGPRIIEVNFRMGGLMDVLVAAACGAGLVRAAAEIAVGTDPTVQVEPGEGVTLVHHPAAPTVAFEVLRTPRRGDLETDSVTRFRPVMRAGEAYGASVGTRWLAVVVTRCPSHADVARWVQELGQRTRYRIRADGGERDASLAEIATM